MPPNEMMNVSLFPLVAALLFLPALVASCVAPERHASFPAAAVPVEELTGYFEDTGTIPGHLLQWEDDPSLPGKLLIVVDKKKQMMYVYRGTRRIAYGPVSSGRRPGMTPAGCFLIASKEKDHHSYYGTFIGAGGEQRDGDIRKDSAGSGERFEPASMPYFMRVNGAIGIHEGYLPGHPSSHGCIRLPHLIAKNLFEVASVGTRVIVRDGSWNIHDLQKKPDEHFKTVHRPVAAGTERLQAAKDGGHFSSSGKDIPVKTGESTKEGGLGMPRKGVPSVAEVDEPAVSSPAADVAPVVSDHALESIE